jgi:hypothetical protein
MLRRSSENPLRPISAESPRQNPENTAPQNARTFRMLVEPRVFAFQCVEKREIERDDDERVFGT